MVLYGGALTGRPSKETLLLLPFIEKAYVRTGRPLREGWALTGSPLRRGRSVLAGGSLTGLARSLKKDDEEAYGKAGPLREALYVLR